MIRGEESNPPRTMKFGTLLKARNEAKLIHLGPCTLRNLVAQHYIDMKFQNFRIKHFTFILMKFDHGTKYRREWGKLWLASNRKSGFYGRTHSARFAQPLKRKILIMLNLNFR